MSSFLLLSNLDFGRALGANPLKRTPDQVANWLIKEYVTKSGGLFNYDPAIKCLYEMFRGNMSLEEARQKCATSGVLRGRAHNVQAIECIGPYALSNVSSCRKIGKIAVRVGKIRDEEVYIGVKAPLIRFAKGSKSVVLPGFRKTCRPMGAEIDVACSFALAALEREDLIDVDFEYLDAGSELHGERFLRVHSGRGRRIYNLDDVDTMLDVYIKGVALALESGVEAKKANLRGYHVVDPDQPSMFG